MSNTGWDQSRFFGWNSLQNKERGIDQNVQNAQNRGLVGSNAAQQEYNDARGWYGAAAGDYNAAHDAAGQQQQALGLMQQAAQGMSPSAAQIQMQQGTDAAIRAQMGVAASTRGGGFAQAAAQRNAMDQGTQLQNANIQNSAALRAHEMAQARQAYLQGTNDFRASQQAQAQLGANIASQQGQLGVSMGQLANQSQQNNDQTALGWGQIGEGYTGIAQQGMVASGETQAQINMRNRDRNYELAKGAVGAGMGMAGGMMMSDERSKFAIRPLDYEGAAPPERKLGESDYYDNQLFGDRKMRAPEGTPTGTRGWTPEAEGVRQRMMYERQLDQTPESTWRAADQTAHGISDEELAAPDAQRAALADRDIRSMRDADAEYADAMGGKPYSGLGGGPSTQAAPAAQQGPDWNQRFGSALMGVSHQFLSDENQKTNVQSEEHKSGFFDFLKPRADRLEGDMGHTVRRAVYPQSFVPMSTYRRYQPDVITSDRDAKTGIRAEDTPVDHFLNDIHPVRYEYKRPELDGAGPRVGIIAQDAARSPVGRTMLRETPRGLAIDEKAGMGVLFAAAAALDDRVRQLEAGSSTLGPKGRGRKGGE